MPESRCPKASGGQAGIEQLRRFHLHSWADMAGVLLSAGINQQLSQLRNGFVTLQCRSLAANRFKRMAEISWRSTCAVNHRYVQLEEAWSQASKLSSRVSTSVRRVPQSYRMHSRERERRTGEGVQLATEPYVGGGVERLRGSEYPRATAHGGDARLSPLR